MLHVPVWSVYFVSLHYHHRLSHERFLWSDLLILVCLTLTAAGAYYINQVYDYESDERNRKLGFLQNGLVSAKTAMALFIALSVVALGTAVLFSLATFAIILFLFVLSYFYSAPPLRLKDHPTGGWLANAFGYGFVIPLSVMPDITFHNAGLLGWDNPFYFFLAVGSIYVLTTLPDREGDMNTGKRTLAVVLPRGVVISLALAFMLASAWVAYYSGYFALMYISIVSAVPILLCFIIRSPRMELLSAKLPILLLTLLAGYFFPVYFLFIVAIVFGTRIYYRKRFSVTYPELA